MAILESLPGIEVTVCTGGQAIMEYESKNEPSTHLNAAVALHQDSVTVTKYIKSVTNQVFTIKLDARGLFKLNGPGLTFDIFADGEWIQGALVEIKDIVNNDWSWVVRGPHIKVDKDEKTVAIREMKFAHIAMTSVAINRAAIDQQKKSFNGVGQISVKVLRVSVLGVSEKLNVSKFGGINHDSQVNEKALKGEAKLHGVELGDVKQVAKRITWEVAKIDGRDYPKGIFAFNYRSQGDLQSLLVIPRSHSPEPECLGRVAPQNFQSGSATSREQNSAKAESEDDLTKEELALLQRLQQRLARSKAARGGKVKQEVKQEIQQPSPSPSLSPSLPASTVKREREESGSLVSITPAPKRPDRSHGALRNFFS